MDRERPTRLRLVASVVLLTIAMLGLTGCKADHWIVIHNKVAYQGGSQTCEPPMPGDTIAFLPSCISVAKGDKIGFANYTEKTVEIYHFKSLKAPDPIKLGPGQTGVFKVDVQGQLVQFNIRTTADHGGPDMIVQP